MPKVEFTTEQKKVIEAPVCDLLVSAAAGSGKTAVLVERIIQHLCDKKNPIEIDKILIVTFTRNAAASMKERIYKALEKLCEQEPENRYYALQLQKLAYADITTIDSFCLKVVRNYFFVADIDPNFRIDDGSEADLLLYDAIIDVMEEEYERGDAAFLAFMSAYDGTKATSKVNGLVKNIIIKSKSYPWQEDFFTALSELYIADSIDEFYNSDLAAQIISNAKTVVKDCIDIIKMARTYIPVDDSYIKFIECVDLDHDFYKILYKALCNSDAYSAFKRLYQENKFKNFPSMKNADVSQSIIETVKSLRNRAKELLKDLYDNYFKLETDKIIEDNRILRPHVETLVSLTKKVIQRFSEVKKNRNLMEFSDIAHAALEILVNKDMNGNAVPTQYAEELREKYDEIMIDEYQDSNYIQEVILNSISRRSLGEPNIFMVGDVKQSIYKFRMAKPELFMDKYASFGKGTDKSLVIDLSKNFRSAGCVIETVNNVFESIMTDKTCGISYDSNAALNQGADYGNYEESEEAVSELHLIDTLGASGDDKPVFEAAAIAERIKKLMNENFEVIRDGVPDKLRFSDIVILVRSMTKTSIELANRLPDEGIPAYVNTTSGYFKTVEITLMLNYLRVLDNPYQDIEMASVLRSYCGGLTDEELALIKIFDKSRNENPSYLYEAALDYMNSDEADTECKEKLSVFFKIYENIRNISVYSGIREVLLAIFEQTGYYNYVQILPAGKLRKANLDMLLIKAGSYEKTGFSGVNSFLRYVDKLIKYEIDSGEANMASGTDAVKIMTIHASKGLEFPVVILADTDKQFNRLDETAEFVLHSDRGIGLKVVNTENNSFHKSIQKQFLSGIIHNECIAEEIRVLYVALTRPKQKLIIFASVKDFESSMAKWKTEIKTFKNELSYSYINQASNYADLLAPVFLLKSGILDSTIDFSSDVIKSAHQSENKINKQVMKICYTNGDWLLKNISEKLVREQERSWPVAAESDIRKEIEEYFTYEYPYDEENIPVKYSVSELKHKAMEEYELELENASLIPDSAHDISETEPEPAFIHGESVKSDVNMGALRGTLTHMLMQRIVSEKVLTLKEIKEYVEKNINDGVFSENIRMVNLRKAASFLNSDIGQRLLRAHDRGDLYMEQPFVIGVPACEIDEAYKSRDLIMIQGIIDVFFIEDGEAVLLDYKTDSVDKENGEAVLYGRYKKQLDLYAEAIEKIKKIPVKSKIIYSFSLEKELYL